MHVEGKKENGVSVPPSSNVYFFDVALAEIFSAWLDILSSFVLKQSPVISLHYPSLTHTNTQTGVTPSLSNCGRELRSSAYKAVVEIDYALCFFIVIQNGLK